MDGRTHKHGIRPTGRQNYFNIYMKAKYKKKMVSRVNTRTNGLFICVHTTSAHSPTHAYTPRINIAVRSKKFGVRNKEYHGHAYMHQT